jgi:carbon storage regulator
VLQRKEREQIVIGDELVIIEVVRIKGDKVKLAITAAKELTVHRREVYEAIKRERGINQKG